MSRLTRNYLPLFGHLRVAVKSVTPLGVDPLPGTFSDRWEEPNRASGTPEQHVHHQGFSMPEDPVVYFEFPVENPLRIGVHFCRVSDAPMAAARLKEYEYADDGSRREKEPTVFGFSLQDQNFLNLLYFCNMPKTELSPGKVILAGFEPLFVKIISRPAGTHYLKIEVREENEQYGRVLRVSSTLVSETEVPECLRACDLSAYDPAAPRHEVQAKRKTLFSGR